MCRAPADERGARILATATEPKAADRQHGLDGALLLFEQVRRDEPKVGRNDPCPCGSGKKFKQCHGAK